MIAMTTANAGSIQDQRGQKTYRDKAEACRQSAKDAREVEGWLKLADQWTRLADETAWAAALR
jgi:hypothetical protein